MILAISKKTEQVYIYMREIILLWDNNVDWVPLMVDYFFLNDDDNTRLCMVPQTVYGIWLSKPKPSNFGFEIKTI